MQLGADGAMLDGLGPELTVGGVRARRGATFGEAAPGDLVVFVDSAGRAAVAVNGGRAVVVLSVVPAAARTARAAPAA